MARGIRYTASMYLVAREFNLENGVWYICYTEVNECYRIRILHNIIDFCGGSIASLV